MSNGTAQFAYGMREPYGVVGRIIPFNHPFKFAAQANFDTFKAAVDVWVQAEKTAP